MSRFDFDIVSLASHVPLLWYEKCKRSNPDEVGDATIDYERDHAEAVFQEQYKNVAPSAIQKMTNGELCQAIVSSFNDPTHLFKSILPRGFGTEKEIVEWFRYVVYRSQATAYKQSLYTVLQSETILYFERKDEKITMYAGRKELMQILNVAKQINRFVIVPIEISTEEFGLTDDVKIVDGMIVSHQNVLVIDTLNGHYWRYEPMYRRHDSFQQEIDSEIEDVAAEVGYGAGPLDKKEITSGIQYGIDRNMWCVLYSGYFTHVMITNNLNFEETLHKIHASPQVQIYGEMIALIRGFTFVKTEHLDFELPLFYL